MSAPSAVGATALLVVVELAGCGRSGFDAVEMDDSRPAPGSCGVISGLVGYWKFDETIGTTAVDSSSNGNNGTLHGSATWSSTGKVGGALTLSAGAYVRVPDVPSLALPTAWTVSIWVRPASLPSSNNDYYIFHKTFGCIDCDSTNYKLEMENADHCGGYGFGALFNDSSQAEFKVCYLTPLTIGVWVQVAASWDGTTLRMYLGGSFASSSVPGSSPDGSPGYPLDLGGVANPNDRAFIGTIDEARVYNRALSAPEISALNNGGAGCAD